MFDTAYQPSNILPYVDHVRCESSNIVCIGALVFVINESWWFITHTPTADIFYLALFSIKPATESLTTSGTYKQRSVALVSFSVI